MFGEPVTNDFDWHRKQPHPVDKRVDLQTQENQKSKTEWNGEVEDLQEKIRKVILNSRSDFETARDRHTLHGDNDASGVHFFDLPLQAVLDTITNNHEKHLIVERLMEIANEEMENCEVEYITVCGVLLSKAIEIGGVVACNPVIDFFERNTTPFERISDEDAEKKLVEILGKKKVKDIKNDPDEGFYARTLESMKAYMGQDFDRSMLSFDDGDLRDLHVSICDSVLKKELNREDRLQWISALSKTLGMDSKGCLDNYVEVFERLGVEDSFPYLLQNLKSENELLRRMSAEILYSLELSSLKISPEGVLYFNKIYKLIDKEDGLFWENYYHELLEKAENVSKEGEFAISDAIKLLDEEGKVGIFGKQGLLGFFKLELEGGVEQVNVDVIQLAVNDFFLKKADDGPEAELLRKTMMETILEEYARVRVEVERKSGLKLHALKLHEQGWFLAFWTDKKTTQEEKERFLRIVKKYGTNGIKTFLTLDYGESSGDLISFLESKNIDEPDKKKLLRNYAHMLDRSFEWRKAFEAIETGLEFKFAAESHEAMIRKSTEILRQAMILDNDSTRRGEFRKLLEGMSKLTKTMEVCTGLYGESRRLALQESRDTSEHGKFWRFHDTLSQAQLKISIRTKPEIDINRGGKEIVERINITLQPDRRDNKHKRQREEVRIGFDLDRVKGTNILSMDWGFGRKMNAGLHPTEVLGNLVPDTAEEGGHASVSFRPETSEHFPEITERLWTYLDERYPTTNLGL